MFQTGYILNRRGDVLWFLTLPFLAIGLGLAGQEWLPATAAASIGLWVTTPHHFATWLRTFGFDDEWQRWKLRLVAGPILIFATILIGLMWSPLTVAVLVMLWDHQHSLMQQYGFARIYDFKAKTGAPSTATFDLALSWILYTNMFLASPYWTQIWIFQLFEWNIAVHAPLVKNVHAISWTITFAYLAVYAIHLLITIRSGHRVNPIKYAFLGASYFLWYFIAWYSTSLLLYMIAHRIMHGLQYDVIVYSYIKRKVAKTADVRNLMKRLGRPGNVLPFIFLGLLYAFSFAFLVGNELTDFGLGLLRFNVPYDSLRELGIGTVIDMSNYQLFAAMTINAVALVHYYYDSFIWKVRDVNVQTGL